MFSTLKLSCILVACISLCVKEINILYNVFSYQSLIHTFSTMDHISQSSVCLYPVAYILQRSVYLYPMGNISKRTVCLYPMCYISQRTVCLCTMAHISQRAMCSYTVACILQRGVCLYPMGHILERTMCLYPMSTSCRELCACVLWDISHGELCACLLTYPYNENYTLNMVICKWLDSNGGNMKNMLKNTLSCLGCKFKNTFHLQFQRKTLEYICFPI